MYLPLLIAIFRISHIIQFRISQDFRFWQFGPRHSKFSERCDKLCTSIYPLGGFPEKYYLAVMQGQSSAIKDFSESFDKLCGW
jgi:hypothetical protein